MATPEVHRYRDYLKFIVAWQGSQKQAWGLQRKMADAMGCSASQLSRALSGSIHFTFDQVAGFAEFAGLRADEREYLFALFQENRASSPALKRHFAAKITELARVGQSFQGRTPAIELEDSALMSEYYGSWAYSAIHILCAIPGHANEKALADSLHLPLDYVERVVERLLHFGLLDRKGGSLALTGTYVHLRKGSAWNAPHHLAWRQKAVEYSQMHPERGLHFTGTYAVSRRDSARVAAELKEVLNKFRKDVTVSPEETLVCLNLDCFELAEI